ncbi:MAG: DUF169 domain-containing protein [Actinomycetota bacterium]|nr:DUF169 domain-containing protein [Actinomycetota bacterium]MDP9020440.1 DUF169 domain-containing protein [Actinomycetota bacterium]
MPTPLDVQQALGLEGAPVALAFLPEPPPGVARWDGGPVAAGCAFWRHARDGRTFYTVPADHHNCAVGSHVHGIALPDDRASELEETLGLMASAGYVDPAEVPGIPTVSEPPGVVAYGPAATAPFAPSVVVVAATPAGAMLLHEAALRAGATPMTAPVSGRPGCAVLPLAMREGQVALSLGCAGNRMTTELGDHELYVAVPGPAWPAVVEALGAVLEANEIMNRAYRERAVGVALVSPGSG